MAEGQQSLIAARGWRAVFVRFGHRRAVAAITVFSVLSSVAITATLLHLLGQHEKLLLLLLISALVPAVVAPITANSVVQLLYELEEARAALLDMAMRDPLTQVFNRRSFMDRLEVEADRSQRNGTPLALVMFDADYFKSINDSYGHVAGDQVLQGIAMTVTATLRTYDVFARYGGEEFVVLMPEIALTDACAAAERIREAIASLRLQTAAGDEIRLTVSLGISAFTAADARAASILDRADAALYAAKHGGRNRWVCFLEKSAEDDKS